MDPIIEEMAIKVLNYGHHPNRLDLTRWIHHLQGVVQPQLDELARLQTRDVSAREPKRRRATT